MNSYLVIKYLHILSAILLIGTGLGIAFFMYAAYRSRDMVAIRIVFKYVVIADFIFTTPAIIMQFVTGILLMQTLGYSFSSVWFRVVIGVFIFIGMCWLPVVFIQIKLRNIAYDFPSDRQQVLYHKLMKYWIVLGCMAFTAIIYLLYLMVLKPFPIS